jgi:hypothetical protein
VLASRVVVRPRWYHGLRGRGDEVIEEGCGNLLTADVEALVNTVGVMGKGIALQVQAGVLGSPGRRCDR